MTDRLTLSSLDQRRRETNRLTDERRLSQVSSPPEHHLQELVLLVHHVVLLLQRDPGPVQTELLSLQLVPTWTKNTRTQIHYIVTPDYKLNAVFWLVLHLILKTKSLVPT